MVDKPNIPEGIEDLIEHLKREDESERRSHTASTQSLLAYIAGILKINTPQKLALTEHLTQSGPALLALIQRALGI